MGFGVNWGAVYGLADVPLNQLLVLQTQIWKVADVELRDADTVGSAQPCNDGTVATPVVPWRPLRACTSIVASKS